MSNIVIQAEAVSKLYRLGTLGTGSLRRDMTRWWQREILKKQAPFFIAANSKESASSSHIWALRM
jgi:lipopolysaccharide transport system ATP-binding protein